MHGSGAAANGRHTESGPADSATKDDTEVNRIEEGEVVPPPRVELGTC